MDIKALVNGIKNCDCGKDHLCPIKYVEISENAVSVLPECCNGYSHIMLVADENTYAVCGKNVEKVLEGRLDRILVLENSKSVVIPDEKRVEEINSAMPKNTDLIIGVGSGVINDLCKYVSFAHSIPYYIVATAPSMDGYASAGAAMMLGGMKVTPAAAPPKGIFADISVIKNAPLEMLQAGYGDILGKYSCLNDWRLSELINGEYFCGKVYSLTADTVNALAGLAGKILARDGEAVKKLMEALVTVGIAMSYVGTSRPASGSEHHFAHFFEVTGIVHGVPYYPHGIDVLYSSYITARIREALIASHPAKKAFGKETWEANIRRIYGSCADGVIALQEKLGWYERDSYDALCEKWQKICEILASAPSAEETEKYINAIGLDINGFYEFYGKQKISDAVYYAKDLKDRYSVLWLIKDTDFLMML